MEYIEYGGTQWIDTNYSATTSNITINAEVSISALPDGSQVYDIFANGHPSTTSYGKIAGGFTANEIFLYDGVRQNNVNIGLSEFSLNEKLSLSFIYDKINTKRTLKCNSISYVSNEYSAVLGSVTSNFWLGHSELGELPGFVGKMYSISILDNGTLVRNMIPARNSDGVLGMYDTVNDVFYTNSGTGTFTAGPAVSSCGYTELEYLELQGEAYFNTNVYLSKDMDIEFEFMPTKLDTTGVLALNRNVAYGGLQVAYNINNVIDPQYIINDTLVDFFGTTSSDRWTIKNNNSNYILENNKKYKLSIVNKVGSFYKNGTQLETYTYTAPGESPMTTPLYINAISFQNGQSIAPTYINGNLHIRFYHFSATGVADIVPVKRDCDNVLGLYNKTTGEFLEKIGSGTLVAGPELSQTIAIHWGGLTEPDASGTCTYGETFTAPSTAPTAPSGLKFLGWRPM